MQIVLFRSRVGAICVVASERGGCDRVDTTIDAANCVYAWDNRGCELCCCEPACVGELHYSWFSESRVHIKKWSGRPQMFKLKL